MKARILVLLVLMMGCLLLSGCPAFSGSPLYTKQDAVEEPALEGTWITTEDKEQLVFRKVGDHLYQMAVQNPATQSRQNYEVHLVRLTGQLFMDIMFDDQWVGDVKVDDPAGTIAAHVIVKFSISGNDLAYATLEDDAIKKHPSGRPLAYYDLPKGPLLVTADTTELRKHVAAHVDDGFSKPEHFQRKVEGK